jgi:outer membrane biosynthesis protein TonB
MTIRAMMIGMLVALAWPVAGLAQDAIPLASQRTQASPPAPWPDQWPPTGLSEPIQRPPLAAAPALKAAQVGVRLEVGMRGYVTRCTVTKPSRHAELNDEACDALLHRRLQPARDAAGKPMAATLDTVVHWQLANLPTAVPVSMPVMTTTVPSPPSAPKPPETLWPFPAADSWTVGASPRGAPQMWITNDDYPSAALRAEQQGTTHFALLLDAAGVPLDCVPTSSSGSLLLDNLTCDLLVTRARFNPARNAQGILVPSTWRSRMRWELPSE